MDDSIFMCDGEKENLQVIIRILRLFELMSSLKVNYNKSTLYGWNIDENLIEEGVDLLGYEKGESQILFLGLKVGINPHKIENWSWLL